MKVLVQHATFNNETGEVLGYTDVALVNANSKESVEEALEYAYRYTNNVMGSWSIPEQYLPLRDGGTTENGDYNPDVTVLCTRPNGMGLRSSMIGDRFIIDDVVYKCDVFGFKELEIV
jgi:hypothetical protein